LPFLDVDGTVFQTDPLGAVTAVRGLARLARSRRGLEVLVHDTILELIPDRRLSPPLATELAASGASPMIIEFIAAGVKSFMDPEAHGRARRIFGQPFRAARIDAMRPQMSHTAHSLIDGFARTGYCDLVADFSDHLSILALCEMIGIPAADMPRIAHYLQDVVLINADPMGPVVLRIEAAITVLTEYVEDLIEQRRDDPRDDVIGALIEAERTEGGLSARELTAGIVDLMFAGQDTTRLQLPSIARALLEHDSWDRLRQEPDLVPSAVEEGMRWYPAVHHFTRVVRQEGVEVEGVPVPVGERIIINALAASRDPDRFADPERFDVRRAAPRFTAGFGGGMHYCLGHAFARATLAEGIVALTSRLSRVKLAGPLEIGPGHGATVNGVERMPITFWAADRQPLDPTG
jgi:cytochrome P450